MSLSTRWILVVLLCACFALASAKSVQLKNRIIGGHSAVEKQFPYHVSLRHKEKDLHFCGGSIISKQYILSAAHCLMKCTVESIYGTVNLTHAIDDGTRVDFLILIKHHLFKQHSQPDIALLRTLQPIVSSEFVKPIKLPTQEHIEYETLTVAGWGLIEVKFILYFCLKN